jgi:hypothetical protein
MTLYATPVIYIYLSKLGGWRSVQKANREAEIGQFRAAE